MLPVLSRTLRTSEAASAAPASGRRMTAALRRRARVAQKYAHTQEHGAVFKVSAAGMIIGAQAHCTDAMILGTAHNPVVFGTAVSGPWWVNTAADTGGMKSAPRGSCQ